MNYTVSISLSQWEELYELNLFEVSMVVCAFAKKKNSLKIIYVQLL